MADSSRGVEHADSFDSHDGGPNEPEKKKNRRPANTAFRQQRLKAWQPILTPKTVLPLFFAIGIIFAPIGGLLLYASSQVQEIRIDYTRCQFGEGKGGAPYWNKGKDMATIPSSKVTTAFKKSSSNFNPLWATRNMEVTLETGKKKKVNQCIIQFTTPEDMGKPVFFYYHLTNFYQNHRRYVESFDYDQLKGKARSYSQIKGSNCDPLEGKDGKPYYPCGLIANSMFNDTYSSPVLLSVKEGEGNGTWVYEMNNKTKIAWDSDKDLYGDTSYKPDDVLPPPNWVERYDDGKYTNETMPNLKEWEAFQVWMRTAGLPSFSKLYQRNDTAAMPQGTYQIIINDFFKSHLYKGKKSIIISTRTVIGGRNPFLGIAYLVVGGLCIVLGAVFTVTHLFKPRKLGDHTYLSWNNAPGAKAGAGNGGSNAAMASGREIRPDL